MQTVFRRIGLLGVLGLFLLALPAWAEDAPPPLMTYGVDLVSDYVDRGTDLFVRQFKDNEHSAFHVAPAIQPQVTLNGPSGISLNLRGSFAVSDRADDTKKRFLGLGRDDELAYTLAFDWGNKLGEFQAALVYYTYFDSCFAGNTNGNGACNASTPAAAPVQPDAKLAWKMPFAKPAAPTLTYYANPTPGAWYATFDLSGGESIVWAASIGEVREGIKDVTGKIGIALGGLTISLNGSYRPNPELVGPYDKDGKYLVKGVEKTYPSTILWVTIGYGGSVAAH